MKKLELVALTACLVLVAGCGFTDHEVVQNTCPFNTGGLGVTCEASCPAGKKVTGGGWSAKEIGGAKPSDLIEQKGRIVADMPTGADEVWTAKWEPNVYTSGELHVWAICANVGTP